MKTIKLALLATLAIVTIPAQAADLDKILSDLSKGTQILTQGSNAVYTAGCIMGGKEACDNKQLDHALGLNHKRTVGQANTDGAANYVYDEWNAKSDVNVGYIHAEGQANLAGYELNTNRQLLQHQANGTLVTTTSHRLNDSTFVLGKGLTGSSYGIGSTSKNNGSQQASAGGTGKVVTHRTRPQKNLCLMHFSDGSATPYTCPQ